MKFVLIRLTLTFSDVSKSSVARLVGQRPILIEMNVGGVQGGGRGGRGGWK